LSALDSGRKGAALGVICALAIALSACGGDDEEPATTTSTPAGASGATGGVGAVVTADDLVSCLDGAGLEATVDDSPVIGLEGQHEKVYLALGDSDEAAVFAVFASAEAAEAEAEAFDALGGVANTQVAGNIAYGFDAGADETPEDEAAVEGCLP
jgi:hypothetical protein